MTRCEYCCKVLPEHSGRGRRRRFCSDACRQRAHRAGRTMPVPPDMAMADRWLRRRLAARARAPARGRSASTVPWPSAPTRPPGPTCPQRSSPRRVRVWAKINPSGQGLHIWNRCGERKGVKVRGLRDAEAYSQCRYMTYTGHAWRDSPARRANITILFAVIKRTRA